MVASIVCRGVDGSIRENKVGESGRYKQVSRKSDNDNIHNESRE